MADGRDFYLSSAFADGGFDDSEIDDSEILSDSFRDLIGFQSTPVADPCIYSATISSLSHNRLAREASALLKSYSARGIFIILYITIGFLSSVKLSFLYWESLFFEYKTIHSGWSQFLYDYFP